MSQSTGDYSVFDKFNFERKPVGVKFSLKKPDGVERLSKALNFCEMFKEAQNSNLFYVTKGDFHCVEPLLLGMVDPEPVLLSGLFGETVDAFKDARANRKLYQYIPMMLKGSVNYVAFSPIDQLPFAPDVLIFTANVSQAQTLLRARSYTSGDFWSGRGTFVVGCAWLYIYPAISGEMNYTVTGLHMGMHVCKVLPPGLFLISIPWNLLPMMMEALQDMPFGITAAASQVEMNLGDGSRHRLKN